MFQDMLDLLGVLVRGQRPRRNLMFVICLGAMVLVALGCFPLRLWLDERPVLFLCFWGLVFVVVVLLMLLALYDILRLLSRR